MFYWQKLIAFLFFGQQKKKPLCGFIHGTSLTQAHELDMNWINAAKGPLFLHYLIMLKSEKRNLYVTFYQCPTCVYVVSVIGQKGL